MSFRSAVVSLPVRLPPKRASAQIARLLNEESSVVLRPHAPDGLLSHLASLADGLPTSREWREQVSAELTARGLRVGGPASPPDLLITHPTAPVGAISAALEAGMPALLTSRETPVQRIGLLVWGTATSYRPAAPLLAGGLGVQASLHVLSTSEVVPSPEMMASVLGLRSAPSVHQVGGGVTEHLARLRQLIDDLSIDLLVVMAPTGLALHALVGILNSLRADALLVPAEVPLLGGTSLELFSAHPARHGPVVAAVAVDAAGLVWQADDADYTVVIDGKPAGQASFRNGFARVRASGGFGLASNSDRPVGSLVSVGSVLELDGPPVSLVPGTVSAQTVEALRATGDRVWCLARGLVSPLAVLARTGADAVLSLEAVLEQGRPSDIPSAAERVLFERAVRKLRADGVPIGVARAEASLAGALTERCGAIATSASELRWLTDNHAALEHSLGLIEAATERVHLQTYMFEEDSVGQAFAEALERAAGRGVAVRVMVDSLWSLHGSLRRHRPLLDRLSAVPGVALRAVRPVGTLVDLKRRNHRKLLVVDGRAGAIHGRNISDHYFRSFSRVSLTPHTPEDLVPWLDLSVGLWGEVVREMDATFLETWVASQGDPFPLVNAPGPGMPLWWVTHRSLEDAHTLDVFRVLLEHAEREVTLVNSFTMSNEIQRALLDTLERGVRVRILVGHVRPHFRAGSEAFPGSQTRDLMTELVHGRLDGLARAGADVRAYATEEERWSDAVGTVLPHVHAKLLLVDGHLCATGSANVDITSSYWESEALIVVDHEARVGELAAWLDECFSSSIRFDPEDDQWVQRAAQRAWFAEHWPGLLS